MGDNLSEFPGVKDLLQLWSNDNGDMMMMDGMRSPIVRRQDRVDTAYDEEEDDYTPIPIELCSVDAESVDESCDNRSRASQKRRRVSGATGTISSQTGSNIYRDALTVTASSNKGSAMLYQNRNSEFIDECDVILGDPHTPTIGTNVYRQIRQVYAKRKIKQSDLAIIREQLTQKLKEMMNSTPTPTPTFWYSIKNKSKLKEGSPHRYLKSHIKKGAFGIATDQAVIEDVRNAPKRSRVRKKDSTPLFGLEGSLSHVVSQAKTKCEEWVGANADKELYAKFFKEDLQRLIPWCDSYVQKKTDAETNALHQPDLKQTFLREARVHDIHAKQLDGALVSLVNQLGNDMVERYQLGQQQKVYDDRLREVGSVAASVASSRSGLPPRSRLLPHNCNESSSTGPTIISSDMVSAPGANSMRTLSTGALSNESDTPPHTSYHMPYVRPEDPSGVFTQSLSVRFSKALNVSPKRVRDCDPASVPLELRLRNPSSMDDHSVSSVSKESSAIRSGSCGAFRPIIQTLQHRRENEADEAAARETVLANSDVLHVRPGSPADSSLASEDLLADDSWIVPVPYNNSACSRAKHIDTVRTLDLDSDNSLEGEPTEDLDWNKALANHLKTLEDREARLRKYHPDTAKSYNNLGHIYSKLGNWNEALHYHRMALEVRESVLGKENLDTVRSYSSMGYVFFKKCDWDEALLYYRMALEVQQTVLGKSHGDTAKSHKSIAVVLSKKGAWNEALRHHRMALEAREARLSSRSQNDTPGSFGRVRASWQGRVRSMPSSIAEE